VSKLHKLNVNHLKILKNIAGRTKLPRGPHVAGGPPYLRPCSKVCNFAVPLDHLLSEISYRALATFQNIGETRKQEYYLN